MTKTDFLCLAPLIILASAPVIMMLTLTIIRNFRVIYGFSLFMFAASFLSLVFIVPGMPHIIEPLLIFDHFSTLFTGIIIIAALLITIISFSYFRNHGGEKEEYFIVLFVATLGATVLVTANHFISFFIGLETLSVSLYIMIAYLRNRDYSIEASIKFLIVASVATAFMLFGMALIYAETGSMGFARLSEILPESEFSPLILAGTGMFLVGVGFKMALVPFHMWAPDVYQGAPAPVTAFIATISKGAIIAVALRFFIMIRAYQNDNIVLVLSVIAVLSMFTGNLLALQQKDMKRLLAYSSIAHMGYILITLVSGSATGVQAAAFYVISYFITTLGAFAVISLLSSQESDLGDINTLKNMFQRNPWIAIVFSLCMFSLAGIPLTAGFIAKFYLVLEGAGTGLWILIFSLIINTVISLFYYLRVIKTMFTPAETAPMAPLPITEHIVLATIAIGILLLGLFPSLLTPLLDQLMN